MAFRANFATIAGNEITDRRAGRLDSETAKILEKEANMRLGDIEVIFRASGEHRGALVLRGRGLSPNITSTDSHKNGKLELAKPLDGSPEARKTADAINKFTREIRERLEVNEANLERKKQSFILLAALQKPKPCARLAPL